MGDSGFNKNNKSDSIKLTANQKKYAAALSILAVLGIGVMMFDQGEAESTQPTAANVQEKQVDKASVREQALTELAKSEQDMEKKLEDVLGEIAGVGNVVVKVTLSSSPEYHYATDSQTNKTEINEETKDGSTRVTNETQEDSRMVMKNMTQGEAEPVVVREVRPEVVGVMVVAEGASDLVIKEQVSNAVQTLLSIPSHRVTVLPKERGE